MAPVSLPYMTVGRVAERTSSGSLSGTVSPFTSRPHPLGRNLFRLRISSSAWLFGQGIRAVMTVPRRLSLGVTTRPPIRGKRTVWPAVSITASAATETSSFSPRLKRPRCAGFSRLGVCFIRVQASAMSANPGPSSSTLMLSRSSPAGAGRISTRQMVASGASSQTFCTSSFRSCQGGRPAWISRIPRWLTAKRSGAA